MNVFERSAEKKRRVNAREAKEKLLRILAQQKAQHLASKLGSCTGFAPCESGACDVCNLSLKNLIEKAIDQLAATTQAQIRFVTLLLKTPPIPVGSLFSYDHTKHLRKLREAFLNIPIDWAILALDVSLNETAGTNDPPMYVPHFHGLIASDLSKKELTRRLRDSGKLNSGVRKPVLFESWNGNHRATRYMLKTISGRRISYASSRFNSVTGQDEPCQNTRGGRLRNAEQAEIAALLDRLTFTKRLVLKGIRIVHGPGEKTLTLRRHKRVTTNVFKRAKERGKPMKERSFPKLS